MRKQGPDPRSRTPLSNLWNSRSTIGAAPRDTWVERVGFLRDTQVQIEHSRYASSKSPPVTIALPAKAIWVSIEPLAPRSTLSRVKLPEVVMAKLSVAAL